MDGSARSGHRLLSGVQYGIEEFTGFLFDATAVEVVRAHRDLGDAEDPVFGVDDDGLGARCALINREDGHFGASLTSDGSSTATWSSSASIECMSGMRRPCVPRVTSRYPR